MRGQVAEQNYWPGYLDALINVMLNLLFLVAVFAIGLLLLNTQTMSQQRQLADLGTQSRQVMEELGLSEPEKARLTTRLEQLDVQAMVDRRQLLGQRSEQVAAMQESLDAQVARNARLAQEALQAQQALETQRRAQQAEEARLSALQEAQKKRVEDKSQQLAERERQLRELGQRIAQGRERLGSLQAGQSQQSMAQVIDLRVAGRPVSAQLRDTLAVVRPALGGSPQAVWEYAPDEFAWPAGKPVPVGYAAADKASRWKLVIFADVDNPRVLRESFARANAAREWMVRDGHVRAQIKVELKSARDLQGLGELGYRQVFMMADS